MVHGIHPRTITFGCKSLTAQCPVDPDYPGELETLRRRLRHIACEHHGITHIAIQMEQSTEGCTERHQFECLLTATSR